MSVIHAKSHLYIGLGRFLSFRLLVQQVLAICVLLTVWPAWADGPSEYGSAVQAWENFKARQTPACDAKYDSYEILEADKTEYVALILHGFTHYPRMMDSYSRLFSSLGMNVIVPRLARHYTLDDRDLDNLKYQEWIDGTEEAYKIATRLGRKVIVVGYSLGGLLAARLALTHDRVRRNDPGVDSLYLFSPALMMTSGSNHGTNVGAFFNHFQRFNRRIGLPRSGLPTSLNDMQGLPIGCGHPYYSGAAGDQMHRLMKNNEIDFPPFQHELTYRVITAPLFLGVAEQDDSVPTEYIESVLEGSQSRQKAYITMPGDHGIWTKPAAMSAVPRVKYRGVQGQALYQQILKFFNDSRAPQI